MEEEKLTNEGLKKIDSYLEFKGRCVDKGIFNIDEIIKLWRTTQEINSL